MKKISKILCQLLPWFFVALFAAEIVAVFFAPKKDGEFHAREFGKLPVLLNGRIQPFDSVGLNSLRQIRSTGDVPLEEVPSWKFWHHAKKLNSTEWLLEVLFRPDDASKRPIFLIHHPELLSELKLEDKGVEKSGLRYYTYAQIEPLREEIWKQGGAAREIKDEKLHTPFQRQVIKLQNAIHLYEHLQTAVHPVVWENFEKDLDDFEANMETGLAEMTVKDASKTVNQEALQKFTEPLLQFYKMKDDPAAGATYPFVLPPMQPEESRDAWMTVPAGLLHSVRAREIYPPIKWLATISTAYHDGHAPKFNQAIDDYKNWLAPKFAGELKKGREEFFFNNTKSFLHAMIIYICAFVLAGIALMSFSLAPNLSEALRKSAFYLIMLAWLVHTFGLLFRMHLEGRPPVTNLYSSAIFIGWGAVILGLVLEKVYRVGIGNIVASLAGFVTLVIAHNLALGGDTMEMLRAVLDTNFWLATHVVVVTLGYASTFVAGLLAIIYIFLGVFTPLLSQKLDSRKVMPASRPQGKDQNSPAPSADETSPALCANKLDVGKAMGKMVYGIVCFAMLFSFVGTVLGGIWADQSWGRFWGWDPKENGALIIVIWNAVILHARWGGIIKERGLMAMAVFGNIVTSFSWFGVNMLGIGLHSYGFMDSAFFWLMLFDASQVLIIGIALMPPRFWASFKKQSGPPLSP